RVVRHRQLDRAEGAGLLAEVLRRHGPGTAPLVHEVELRAALAEGHAEHREAVAVEADDVARTEARERGVHPLEGRTAAASPALGGAAQLAVLLHVTPLAGRLPAE